MLERERTWAPAVETAAQVLTRLDVLAEGVPPNLPRTELREAVHDEAVPPPPSARGGGDNLAYCQRRRSWRLVLMPTAWAT